jgi:hypothetical protein
VHQETSDFREREIVFLTSNPEVELMVVFVSDDKIYTRHSGISGEVFYHRWIPQVLQKLGAIFICYN